MIRNSVKGIIGVFALFAGVAFFAPSSASAIGISPALLTVEDIQPNTEVTKELNVSRGDASEAEIIRVTVVGASSQYIELVSDEIDMPAGTSTEVIPFIIKPGSLAAGTYSVTMTVHPRLADNLFEGASAGSAITSGAQAQVQFIITNEEVESYTIQEVTMKESEENQVVGFSYLMVNTGNVDTHPA